MGVDHSVSLSTNSRLILRDGAMYRLRLLGGASIETESGPLAGPVAQRRRIALLALLAVAPPAGVNRERLTAYLFPEVDASHGHRSLSDALHAVRKALGKEAVIGAGDSLRINPTIIGHDVGEFEKALSNGQLERAASLYTGPLLDGFHLGEAPELERWIDGERTRLSRKYARALEALAERQEAAGDDRGAAAWWQRLAAHDPYSSRVALRLMQSLARAGDSAAALQHARVHQVLLREELDAPADPEVVALAERLRTLPTSAGPMLSARRPEEDPPASLPVRSTTRTAAKGESVVTGPATDELTAGSVILSDGAVKRRSSARAAALTLAAGAVILIAVSAVRSGAVSGRSTTATVVPVSTSATARRNHSVDSAAHDLYLRGRYAWNRRSQEALEEASIHFRRAIERDPSYAPAYAGLADSYVMLGYHGFAPADGVFAKGKAAAQRALELEPDLPEAYPALGMALAWERDWSGAEAAFRRGIALEPGYATGRQWYALLLMTLGRTNEAVAEVRRASELDPLSLQIGNTHATLLLHSGDSVGALREYRRIIGSEPDGEWLRSNPWILANATHAYIANGMHREALRAAEQSVKVVPTHPRTLFALAAAHIAMGEREQGLQVFARSDTANVHYRFYAALLSAILGHRDEALRILESIDQWVPPLMSSLRATPELRQFHSDKRFRALLERLGMETR